MTDGWIMDLLDESAFVDCPDCNGTGSRGSCPPDELEPDQSPVEAWGYGCKRCSDTGVIVAI